MHFVRYLRGRIKAGTHGLSAVERAYGRLWYMADRTWQIEHRGEFRLALRRATSLPRGNKRDYVSYKTLVRWRFACALRGSVRGFWFIDPLRLRPRGLCTVATRACHVNHAPPSYNYNIRHMCIGLAYSIDSHLAIFWANPVPMSRPPSQPGDVRGTFRAGGW